MSTLCDEHPLSPSVFYRWQQEFFENGVTAFERNNRSQAKKALKINLLQSELQTKGNVIAEIMAELIQQKKDMGPAKGALDTA